MAGTAVGIIILAFSLFGELQANTEDVLQPGVAGNDDVVIVAVDRESLSLVGELWPWVRAVHANFPASIAPTPDWSFSTMWSSPTNEVPTKFSLPR